MLKLHQLFFRQSALIFTAISIIGASAGYILLRQMEIDTHEKMLRRMAQIIEKDMETLPPDVFARRISELRRRIDARITVINPDGRVLLESDRDPKAMENHAGRPEIIQAVEKEWGSSVRHSHTLEADLLYVAHRQGNRIIRIAYPLAAIKAQLLSLWFKALLFLSTVMGMLFWWSHRLHRGIDRDVVLIRRSLDRLLAKEYDPLPEHALCCLELEEITDLIRKVAKKLAKREKQKTKYTRKLKNLTQRQSDIISAISHEFKNPVAAIMGYAQSLGETRNMEPSTKKRFLGKIHANAEKISLMIDRLALATKLENRSFTPKKSRFCLDSVARAVREMLQQKYPGRTIVLNCETVEIEADRDMMEHLLVNLADNALKYSDEEVIIRCDTNRLEIIDRGIGIDKSEQKKITERFYRIDRISWNNSMGVGLYIVKYILDLHDTKLEIESKTGEGSIFGFSLKTMRVSRKT